VRHPRLVQLCHRRGACRIQPGGVWAVSRARQRDPSPRASCLVSTLEVQLFWKAALEICPDYHPLLVMAMRAELRRGELVAVQWGDVQLGDDDNASERFILVQHNYVRRARRRKARSQGGWICPESSQGHSSNFETNICWKPTWKVRTTFPTNWFFGHPRGRFSTPTTCTMCILARAGQGWHPPDSPARSPSSKTEPRLST
jgi:hypothetical protein